MTGHFFVGAEMSVDYTFNGLSEDNIYFNSILTFPIFKLKTMNARLLFASRPYFGEQDLNGSLRYFVAFLLLLLVCFKDKCGDLVKNIVPSLSFDSFALRQKHKI